MEDWKVMLAFLGPTALAASVAFIANAWCGGCMGGTGGC